MQGEFRIDLLSSLMIIDMASDWTSPLLGFLTALGLTLVLGGPVIRWLRGFAREAIKSDSERLNQLHIGKKETPTMGGILIVAAFVIGAAVAGIASSRVFWGTAFAALSLMTLGAADDWIKRTTSRKGLTARQKLFGQILIGVVASIFLIEIRLPGSMNAARIPAMMAFIAWSTLVITATSNAVNLTDGLDGLASGCTVITSAAMGSGLLLTTVPSELTDGMRQSATLFLTLAGSCAGFLWFNRHPARVFMGDAGSLPIGGILGFAALASSSELTLIICGGVFVVETLSVMLQVFWYRRTKTRILLCSPLHNHFVFRGTRERKIVCLFWLSAAVLSGIGVWFMKRIYLP